MLYTFFYYTHTRKLVYIRLCIINLCTSLKKELRGVAASARGPRISHLFFADDSLIFCKAMEKEGAEVQRILQVYEASSGQQLNRNKTALFFSRNTPTRIQEAIKSKFTHRSSNLTNPTLDYLR